MTDCWPTVIWKAEVCLVLAHCKLTIQAFCDVDVADVSADQNGRIIIKGQLWVIKLIN